ncbi:MAG: FKBP-type peptidyl-prolyl cis-trans isomerase [Bacteroidota bacterium]
MKIKILALFLSFMPYIISAQETVKLTNKMDSVSYAIAVSLATKFKNEGLKDINSKVFSKAFESVLTQKALILDAAQANKILNNFFTKKNDMTAQKNQEEGKKFLEENEKKEGVTTLESGLQYLVLEKGTGATPTLNDQVKTHYRGTLINGNVFDSSYDRGEPITFPVTGVIKGWTEALLLMKEGAKWKLFIPAYLAYGSRGAGGVIPPNATLIFDIELISIEK